LLKKEQNSIKYKNLKGDADISKISIIGIGMRSNVGIAATLFKTLSKNNISILGVATSEIKISCLIPENTAKIAIKALHTAYNLDKN
jgi:aspartate kinase